MLASAALEERLPLILIAAASSYTLPETWADASSLAGTYLLPQVPEVFEDSSVGRLSSIALSKSSVVGWGARNQSDPYMGKIEYLRRLLGVATTADETEERDEEGNIAPKRD